MPQIVEVPGMGEVEFPDDMNDDQIAAAIKANMPAPQEPIKDPFFSKNRFHNAALRYGKDAARAVGLAGRTILNTVASPPLLAADAGIAARNALTGSDYKSGTQMWNEALNAAGVPQFQGPIEKGGDVVGQMLLGSRLPAPSIANQAPANFSPQTVRDITLQASQRAGYTVPPATARPSVTNKMLEGAAGKLSTAQAASAKNQATTQELAKRALGISGEVTPASLDEVAGAAFNKGYVPLRNVGTMRADTQYANDLAKAAARFKGAEKSFPEAAKTEITDFIDKMQKKSFETDSALDMISVLRDRAKTAYRAGDDGLGGAYRAVSKALEDAIERGLSRRGKDGAQLLKNFREARQLIAKTHSVEDALNASTGTVSATKLAQQLAKGKPLSGELRTAAQFGQAFPKAAREFNESLPGISPLDYAASGGLSAATRNPWYLGGAFLRPGIREFLLSPTGQRMLTAPPGPVSPALPMGATYGLLSSGQ